MGNKDKNEREEKSQENGGLSAKQVGWLISAVVALLFVIFNSDKSKISFVVFSAKLPLWVLIIVSMVLGFLLAKLTGGRDKKE